MDRVWLWLARVKTLLFKRVADRELSEEMQFHLDMEVQEGLRRGLSKSEARRAALLAFGGQERYREQVRERRWGRSVDTVAQDVRYGVRVLARSPLFTVVTLTTLALGIGGTTAIFSVVNSVLLSPLPYGEPDDLVRVQQSWAGSPNASISPAEHLDYAEKLDVFEHYGVYSYGVANLTGDGEPERLPGVQVSAGVLPAFGVDPQFGRFFTEVEDQSFARVVVISDGLWQSRFAGATDILGRTVALDGIEFEVIGVMPPEFRLPELLLSGGQSQFFRPLGVTQDQVGVRGSHFLSGIGRLRAGLPHDVAASETQRVAAGMVMGFPDDYPREMNFSATTIPLTEEVRGQVRVPLLVLMGAVGFVLLIACSNVANLLIARSDQRERELALRAALGAGPKRLVTQVLIESVLVSLAGGLLGVGVAAVALRLASPLVPTSLSWLGQGTIDSGALAFAFLASLVTGVLFGLLPAARVRRASLGQSLRDGGRRSSDGQRGVQLRRFLVVGELAFALMLLSGAGLLTRSFVELMRVDPGVRTTNLVSARVALPTARYPDDAEVRTFFRELRPRLNAIPGVVAAAAVSNLPLATTLGDLNFRIEGRDIPQGGVSPRGDWQVVTPGYFEAMGMTLLEGRTIVETDDATSVGVVVVNETLATLNWPSGDALGQRFVLGGQAGPGTVTIVGVVRDVRHEGLDQPDKPQMYLAHEQFRFWNGGGAATAMNLVVHSTLPLAELRGPITNEVHRLDPLLPLSSFTTIEAARAGAVAMPRLLMGLVSAFSLLSLLLAGVGIYGVMAYAAGRRTQEFGIRLALGARPTQVSMMMLGQGIRLAAVGIAIGLAGTYLVTRMLSTVLFGVSPTDPLTIATVAILLGSVALVASWLPARRATKVDAVDSLRTN